MKLAKPLAVLCALSLVGCVDGVSTTAPDEALPTANATTPDALSYMQEYPLVTKVCADFMSGNDSAANALIARGYAARSALNPVYILATQPSVGDVFNLRFSKIRVATFGKNPNSRSCQITFSKHRTQETGAPLIAAIRREAVRLGYSMSVALAEHPRRGIETIFSRGDVTFSITATIITGNGHTNETVVGFRRL